VGWFGGRGSRVWWWGRRWWWVGFLGVLRGGVDVFCSVFELSVWVLAAGVFLRWRAAF